MPGIRAGSGKRTRSSACERSRRSLRLERSGEEDAEGAQRFDERRSARGIRRTCGDEKAALSRAWAWRTRGGWGPVTSGRDEDAARGDTPGGLKALFVGTRTSSAPAGSPGASSRGRRAFPSRVRRSQWLDRGRAATPMEDVVAAGRRRSRPGFRAGRRAPVASRDLVDLGGNATPRRARTTAGPRRGERRGACTEWEIASKARRRRLARQVLLGRRDAENRLRGLDAAGRISGEGRISAVEGRPRAAAMWSSKATSLWRARSFVRRRLPLDDRLSYFGAGARLSRAARSISAGVPTSRGRMV